MESVTECPICLEKYESPAREPTILMPCAHTICCNCTRQISLQQKKCPLCNAVFHQTQKNFAFAALLFKIPLTLAGPEPLTVARPEPLTRLPPKTIRLSVKKETIHDVLADLRVTPDELKKLAHKTFVNYETITGRDACMLHLQEISSDVPTFVHFCIHSGYTDPNKPGCVDLVSAIQDVVGNRQDDYMNRLVKAFL